MILRFLPTATAVGALFTAFPTLAQDGSGDQYHAGKDDQIVVTSVVRRHQQDVLSGIAVLKAEELTAAVRPSIGETLQHSPGTSATSFGPNASRPVLRGLQGERVRLMTNGIGSIDVSNTSVDHAAVVNPLLAERVEVLRGPQALLYGSAAVGGVVNVIDGRVPNAVPDEALHFAALGSYGSAAEERSVAASADVPLGGGFVGHVDGSWLRTGDLRIGGYALSPELRAEALASAALPPDPDAAIDFAANAAQRGTLANTASTTWSAGAGFAYIDTGGSLGVAYSRYDSLYGVPIRLATRPGQEQEAPRITLVQDRIDGRAELTPRGTVIDRATFRVGFADYRHAELAEDGSVGTTFLNQGLEARLELAQAQRGNWTGATGAQYARRDFDVIGDEAFLPRNSTAQLGLFTVQQLKLGEVELEAGGRYEHAALTATPLGDQPQFAAARRSFDAVSGSLGFAYRFAGTWRVGANLAHTQRAPAAEELFANGPHNATQTFEVGDPALGLERATSLEALLRGGGGGWSFELSGFYTRFSGYIYEDRTGAEVGGLPEYRIRQGGADYWGFEAQGEATLARSGGWELAADALADAVRATIDDYGAAPRIPPLRVLGGVSLKSAKFDLRGEVEHVTAQRRTAPNETATAAFTLVNAQLAFRPWGKERPLSLIVSANNLFDVEARRHASFLKDYAPLAGRDIRVSARVEF